jgi:hypothetical protein
MSNEAFLPGSGKKNKDFPGSSLTTQALSNEITAFSIRIRAFKTGDRAIRCFQAFGVYVPPVNETRWLIPTGVSVGVRKCGADSDDLEYSIVIFRDEGLFESLRTFLNAASS